MTTRRIGKRIVSADPKAPRNLHVRLHVLCALVESFGVAMQEGDIERADRPDLAALCCERGFRAREEARLVFAKDGTIDVRLERLGARIDQQELYARMGLGNLGQHVVELEADSDDDLRAFLRGGFEILA